MAFDPINNSQISAGQPVTQDLWDKTKDNFDDHETRILTLEGAIGSFLPIEFTYNGPYSIVGDAIGLLYMRLTFSITINAGRVMAIHAGSSGDTEIDVQFKRGASAFASIFNTLPSVNFSAGDRGIGTGVLNPSNVNLLAGDILRFDLSSSQVGAYDLLAILEFSKT